MPCRVDVCARCGGYYCPGSFQTGSGCTGTRKRDGSYEPAPVPTAPPVPKLDTTGALCDVLTLLESKFPEAFKAVDRQTIAWWNKHESKEKERIKKEALAKLTPREKRALGLK
jgi:hypothetical protein